MRRTATLIILLMLCLTTIPAAMACVGKSLIIGTDSSPRSRAVAQVLAILINERTGTTVEVIDYDNAEKLFAEITEGDVDLALEYAGRALTRGSIALPEDAKSAFAQAKTYYQESFNLVWLPPLGFAEEGHIASVAAPVAQKHALKKFPALSRLIAKTRDMLKEPTITTLAGADNPSSAARDFLRRQKLI